MTPSDNDSVSKEEEATNKDSSAQFSPQSALANQDQSASGANSQINSQQPI